MENEFDHHQGVDFGVSLEIARLPTPSRPDGWNGWTKVAYNDIAQLQFPEISLQNLSKLYLFY